jgi:hypothetical protein
MQTLLLDVPLFLPAQPETPAKRRLGQIHKYLVNVFRGRSSEQGDGRRADHDLILAKLALQAEPIASPPGDVQRFKKNMVRSA